MLHWLDTTACAVALYAVAGLMALVVGFAERRRSDATDPERWPPFWFVTGALLLVMAVGRASNVSDLLADLGRDRARSGGWYDGRRSLQAWVIGAVFAVWVVTVAAAVWRVPERRRRYLPAAIVVFTLVCFAGVRLISLHQIDALLHNREIVAISVGSIAEVSLLLLVAAATAWRFPRANSRPPDRYLESRYDGDPASPVRS